MDDLEQEHERGGLGRFTCNICGAENEASAAVHDRDDATCGSCSSSIRFRSIVLVLSRALFGMDLELDKFPRLKSLRGLGISDSDIYSRRLEDRFSYTNTFYHREPEFNLSRPDESEFGKYDFVICSDVLEHVRPPMDGAFGALARLLKPAGILILTVPYTLANETIEHFPALEDTGLAEVNGRTVLVNRLGDGNYEVFDQLVFHGGHGSTMEMRLFAEADIRAKLTAAGFTNVHFEATANQKFGVTFTGPCSLPIICTREPFSLRASGITELTEQLIAVRTLIDAVKKSRWMRLGRLLGVGPRIREH